MKRKCLIHAISPITCFTVPIIGRTELNLTDEEIYKCLCSKAEIKEILPDGKMINLDFSNYKKPIIKEESLIIKESIVVEEEIVENVTEVKEVVEEDNVEIEEEITEEVTEEFIMEESPAKTHEVPSRNKQQYHSKKNKKNKK